METCDDAVSRQAGNWGKNWRRWIYDGWYHGELLAPPPGADTPPPGADPLTRQPPPGANTPGTRHPPRSWAPRPGTPHPRVYLPSPWDQATPPPPRADPFPRDQEQTPPGADPPPCRGTLPLLTESQTPVKTLPCPNFVAGGKYLHYLSSWIFQEISTHITVGQEWGWKTDHNVIVRTRSSS